MLRPNDGDDLQDFADEVQCCMETLKAMSMMDQIDSQVRMVKIVDRLPLHLQSRWRKEAVGFKHSKGTYPNIEILVDFLNRVTREVNDPVFGVLHKEKPKFRKHGTSFSVNVTETEGQDKTTAKCLLCEEDHWLYTCSQFKALSPEQRQEFAKEKKLCFSCLRAGKHTIRWCRFKKPCGIDGCTSKHSRLLHGTKSQTNPGISPPPDEDKIEAKSCACGPAENDSAKIALPIVAVRVRGRGQGQYIHTHALLDPGSNKSFCSQKLLDMLALHGKSTTLSLSTLNAGKDSGVEVVSLEVTGTTGKTSRQNVVNMPNVYALDKFPSLLYSIATPEEVGRWDHLKDITVPNLRNTDVTMLIGQDVPHAIAPLEVRLGKDYEPYAIRTYLGWVINGPVSGTSDDDSALCNFTHASVEPDNSLRSQMEASWKLDCASELCADEPQMSLEKRHELDIWDHSVTVVKGHYQMDTPFTFELPGREAIAEPGKVSQQRSRFACTVQGWY